MAEKRLRCIVFCGLDADIKIPYEEIGIYNGGIKWCFMGGCIFSGKNLVFGELVKSPLEIRYGDQGQIFLNNVFLR